MSADWPDHFSTEVVRDAFGPRLGGYAIALEAWRRGLRVRLLDSQLRKYEISDGTRKVRFDKARPSLTTAEAVKIEQDKFRTAEYLRDAGVPVPDSWELDPGAPNAEGELLNYADSAGYPLVLKPLRGSMGRDVYTNLRDQAELLETFRYLAPRLKHGKKLVLEEHFEGEDYRVLVVGDRAVATALRLPANVTGDGCCTVQELIERKNTLRLDNPYLGKKPISPDRETDQHLRRLGYSYDSIPADGEEVRLRGTANASQGGDSIDRTDAIPEGVKAAALRAVRSVPGLAIAGVDILFDSSRKLVEDSFRIIELNSRPEIEGVMYPGRGKGRDVPKHIIDLVFPSSQRPNDPMVTSLILNLNQLLAPLRGGSAEQVVVKPKPSHNYPVRRMYYLDRECFAERNKGQLQLAARQAGISGHVSDADYGCRLVVCGTAERVDKFLRLAAKEVKIDLASDQEWSGVIAQGFYFEY